MKSLFISLILIFASTALAGQDLRAEFVTWGKMTQEEKAKLKATAGEYLYYARQMAAKVDTAHTHLGCYRLKNGLILQAESYHRRLTDDLKPIFEVQGGAYRNFRDYFDTCYSGSDYEVVHFFYSSDGFQEGHPADYCLISFADNKRDRYSGFVELRGGKIFNAKINRAFLKSL